LKIGQAKLKTGQVKQKLAAQKSMNKAFIEDEDKVTEIEEATVICQQNIL